MKKENIIYYITVPLLYLVSLLPLSILYLLSDLLKFILFDIVKYRKNVVETNLRNSFPEKSEEERHKIAEEFRYNFTDMLVECVKMMTISNTTLKKHYIVNNLEEIKGLQSEGRAIIGTVGHMFNWEWGGFYNSNPQNNPNPTIIVYQTLQNKKADSLVYKIRSRWGAILTPMEQAVRTMITYRSQPFKVFLAADQYAGKGSNTFQTNFLNQHTYIYMGAEKIAKLTNGVVAFYDIIKIKRGLYKVDIDILCMNPKETYEGEISEMYIRRLEKTIKEHPSQWTWSHRRWK